ncbi:MAG: hypothetical protein LBP22_12220 [Deltaproteobacteria bacterium]|nr:hypothetical protein [Deltaproteobacteria bacterium]
MSSSNLWQEILYFDSFSGCRRLGRPVTNFEMTAAERARGFSLIDLT